MKKILTFLLMAITVQLSAQNYLITGISINLPANPDANTANWGSGTAILTINASTKPDTKGSISEMVKVSKILVTINKGGTKVCGSYTNSTAPASNFTTATKVWSGRNAVSLLGQDCILKPGEYELCVQFFGPKNDPISDEKCKPFSIRSEEQQSYQPPQAISPDNNSVISEKGAKSPLTFRWTPVVPKPRGDVIYKVKVIEVRQDQSPTAAMKSASPIFEKEVTNQTFLAGFLLSQHPIAKDSKYGWYIQAVDREGKPIGGNGGMSGVMLLNNSSCIINYSLQVTDSTCLGEMNGSLKYHIRLKSDYVSPTGNLEFTLPGSGLSAIMPNTPYTPYTILNPPILQQQDITSQVLIYDFDILVPFGTNTVRIGIQGDDLDPSPYTCQPSAWYDVKLPTCICTDCDSVNINIPDRGAITMDSTLWLQTPVNVNPGGIKSIKTQLVYFEYKPENDDCVPCKRKSSDWGNFISGTLSDNEFPVNGSLIHGHELQWNSSNTNGANVSGNFNFHLSLPPLVKCCNVDIKFCIRYIFEFTDCTVCEKVVCYSYSKTSK